MAQWMALIALDAMFGARYHVALRGGFMVSDERAGHAERHYRIRDRRPESYLHVAAWTGS